jgi:hypothetical protein
MTHRYSKEVGYICLDRNIMPVYKVAFSSVVVSRVMIPRGPVLLRRTLRVWLKIEAAGTSLVVSCLVRYHLAPESHGLEEHDTRVNRHLCVKFQSHIIE